MCRWVFFGMDEHRFENESPQILSIDGNQSIDVGAKQFLRTTPNLVGYQSAERLCNDGGAELLSVVETAH